MKGTLFALEQARADVARHRRRWKARQDQLDPHRLAFIDETRIRTNMAPLRGRGPKGQRLRGFAPHGRWRTPTFVGAARCDRLTAPCVFDGPINGACLRACVKQLLVPTLRPGDIVVMDNLASHKSRTVRKAVRAAGARLWFLPKCAPDLNPIEQTFAQIKHCQVRHRMRLAQKRSVDDIWPHLGYLVGTMQPDQCANHFKNAGHAPVKT